MTQGRRVAAIVVVATLVASVGATAGAAPEPSRKPKVQAATLEGPITVGAITVPLDPRSTDLAVLGYVESEWFASGTATKYAQTDERTADGKWSVEPDGTAPYTTRMVVRMPADPKKFSGVVALEWLNVSALELAPDWSYLSDDAIADSGIAWVGVSAQAISIEGGAAVLETGDASQAEANKGLRELDPARYGSLEHPGDAFSFDIYSQVGAALRSKQGRKVFDGARVERVLAIGESQSAGFLTGYVNGIDPAAEVFDGFFVHSRFAGAARYDGSPSLRNTTVGYRIRTDVAVPVFVLETETDVLNSYALARQRDTRRIRVWEVAGTGHSDTYLANVPGLCESPINDGPQHWVAKAAFTHLVDWVTEGTPPPHADRIRSDGTDLHRDDHGIVLGGVRTPDVDVPVATLSGAPGAGEGRDFCRLLGSTIPFDDATLQSLYPMKQAYVDAFEDALDEAIRAGYVRKSDRAAYLARAAAVTIPR